MLRVGLTGGIACGKSTVSDLFANLGTPIIDADTLARELVVPGSKGLSDIVDVFGQEMLTPDGTLDRKAMRRLIFSNHEAKQQLESILHPLISERMTNTLDQLRMQDIPYCIVVIPLLFETRQQDTVDRILVIDCDEDTQFARIMSRDRCTRNDAKKIIEAQISRSEQLCGADDKIINNADRNYLESQVQQLHQFYIQQ